MHSNTSSGNSDRHEPARISHELLTESHCLLLGVEARRRSLKSMAWQTSSRTSMEDVPKVNVAYWRAPHCWDKCGVGGDGRFGHRQHSSGGLVRASELSNILPVHTRWTERGIRFISLYSREDQSSSPGDECQEPAENQPILSSLGPLDPSSSEHID